VAKTIHAVGQADVAEDQIGAMQGSSLQARLAVVSRMYVATQLTQQQFDGAPRPNCRR